MIEPLVKACREISKELFYITRIFCIKLVVSNSMNRRAREETVLPDVAALRNAVTGREMDLLSFPVKLPPSGAHLFSQLLIFSFSCSQTEVSRSLLDGK